jgi:hypothetical protein
MNKTLKWILGIVLVLVLIGGMFAIGFMWRSHAGGYGMMPGLRGQSENYGWQGPSTNERDSYGPMMGRDNYGPMMGHENYYPMMGGRDHFGGGGPLQFVLFIGLLYGAYWLGRRNARIALDPKPGASVAEPPAPQAPAEN